MGNNKKILVAGAAGFIGTNFTEKALKLGYNVLAIDLLTYSGIKNNVSRFKSYKGFNFHKVNILDTKKLIKIINEFKPSHIINFAAESHVDRSIEGPLSFIETNCYGVLNLLEIIKELNLKKKTKLVQISTDEVYGDVNSPKKENSKYYPNSPYSSSKASADLFIQAWNRTYGINYVILHPTNNYGPRQFPEKLIPLMIINAINKKKLPIYGNGKQVREWIFVEDTVDAIFKCLEQKDISGHFNLGSGERYTNLQIVKKICFILSDLLDDNNYKYSDLLMFTKDRPGHDKKYSVNSNLARCKLQWKAKVNINDGLMKTIMWYINNRDWWNKIIRKKYDGRRLGLIK